MRSSLLCTNLETIFHSTSLMGSLRRTEYHDFFFFDMHPGIDTNPEGWTSVHVETDFIINRIVPSLHYGLTIFSSLFEFIYSVSHCIEYQ